MRRVNIGAGSAFWGDMLEPAVQLAERAEIGYLGFDHLSELTMAILTRQRDRDPDKGFIPDIVPWMEACLPPARERGIVLTSNAGGANPRAAAREVAKVARAAGLSGTRIGIVEGDDLLPALDRLRADGVALENMDTGEEGLDRVANRIVAANAYLGADGILEQLQGDADVIVTGRVSDNALHVAPIMHEFGWSYDDDHVDRIAAAITIGHLIECTACATGGMSNMWRISDRTWQVGFPIAEIAEDGTATITKLEGSGGIVNEWTIKEHLLYEIIDPNNYVMPDGVADFTSVQLDDLGGDRVAVSGVRGAGRPDRAKVCIGYRDGYIGEGTIWYGWPDALPKAQAAARWIEQRFDEIGPKFEETRIDFVGVNMMQGATAPIRDIDHNEVGLRVSARTAEREVAEIVRKEVTHLWTLGAVGSAVGVPPRVRPVIALWPTLVPWDYVDVHTDQVVVN